MDKINFNKFIWFTENEYIYIYIYILGGFPIAGLKKQMVLKKNAQK